MLTRNYDLCFETIADKSVVVDVNGETYLHRFDLCVVCAKPVLKFLAEEELWEDKTSVEKQPI